MNEALENHESVLIKSEKAQNRACFVIAAFIMRRYRWSMLKTLEFLNSRRQDLEMRPSFLKQLQIFENKLFKRGLGPKTQKWNEISEQNEPIENDELILRNTYLNSKQGPWAEYSKLSQKQTERNRQPLLRWRDTISTSQIVNHQKPGGSLGFMGCGGSSTVLGSTMKTTNLSITLDYPREIDLINKTIP